MSDLPRLSRRQLLLGLGGAVLAPGQAGKPRVAAVITEFRHRVARRRDLHPHSRRLLPETESRQDPRTRIVSMYPDQVPPDDMSRGFAHRKRYTIYPTIEEALTLGGDRLAVDARTADRRARRLSDELARTEAVSAPPVVSGDRRRQNRDDRTGGDTRDGQSRHGGRAVRARGRSRGVLRHPTRRSLLLPGRALRGPLHPAREATAAGVADARSGGRRPTPLHASVRTARWSRARRRCARG